MYDSGMIKFSQLLALPPFSVTIRWRDVTYGFVFYLLVQAIFAPLFLALFFDLADPDQLVWISAGALFLSAIAVIAFVLNSSTRRMILGQLTLRPLVAGILSWVVVYPVVLFTSQFISYLIHLFYTGELPDQLAVDYLKSTMGHPGLFELTLFQIIILVPLVEELLFRGLLQTGFREFLGQKRAIVLTAAIFALFHFSLGQGVFNVELIVSLFVLACFLGFLYEKYRSLLASFGLHATFNAVSVLMIINQ